MNSKLENALKNIPVWPNEKILSIDEMTGGFTNRLYKVNTSKGATVLRITDKNSAVLGIDRQQEYQVHLEYFRDAVTGGRRSFVIKAENRRTFAEAILKKIIIEICNIEVPFIENTDLPY